MIEVSIEERFQNAASDLVIVSQDRRLLHQVCGEQQETIGKLEGRLKLLDDGQAIILALLQCAASDEVPTLELTGRARAWLTKLGDA